MRDPMRRRLVGAVVVGLVAATLTGTPASAADDTVVVRQDFESGGGGWFARGGAAVAVSDVAAHDGTHSLLTTGRTQSWEGPALDVRAALQPGATYAVSAWVRMAAGRPAGNLIMTVQRTPSGGAQTWDRVTSGTVDDTGWTRLTGDYTFGADVSELQLYVESDNPADSWLLDDVTVTRTAPPPDGPPDQTPVTATFDAGSTQGWAPRIGVENVAVSTAEHHGGTGSLLTTGRTATYTGPAINVLGRLAKGSSYAVSVWAKLAAGEPASALRVSIERRTGGTPSYDPVVADTAVTAGGWVNLHGTYVLSYDVDFLTLYVESAAGLASFYLDDFALEFRRPLPVQTDIPALRDVFAEDFSVGTAIGRVETVGPHAELVRRHFNSVTPGNALKWDNTEAVEGQFNFAEADAEIAFAKANGMRVRGHTLVWHSQVPAWVFQDAAGRELTPGPEAKALVLARLERHIRAVAGRYADDIYAWDVVNEVVDDRQSDGLRRTRWYELTGLDYLRTAFRVTHEVAPHAELFINDFNTTLTRKRQALYDLVARLRAEGVPVDGVGHQMHIDIEKPSAAEIEYTITKFAALGVDQQVTEMDMSVYTNNTESWPTIPPEVLLAQGYRYRDIFDVFRRQRAHLSNVTLWGASDDGTWLKSFPITRLNLPLLFDEQLQAKPAYWGVVDPSRLEPQTRAVRASAATIRVDAKVDPEWQLLPTTRITAPSGALAASFGVRWSADGLYLLADVVDASNDKTDTVEVFLGDTRYRIQRGGTSAHGFTARTKRTDDGYRAEAAIPLPGGAAGRSLPFDVRVTDASHPDAAVSFNDVQNRQDGAPARWGRVDLTAAVPRTDVPRGTPTIDAVEDPAWQHAAEIATGLQISGSPGATASVRLLWDTGHLYVLATVRDAVLSDAGANPWEQDSVELFVDPDNGKTAGYADDDGQYRVSFRNRQTINGNFDAYAIADNLRSATRVIPGGYLVEASIELDSIAAHDGTLLGFEAQVNDDGTGAGSRTSLTGWSDATGRAYLDTSSWGVARLVKG